MMEVTILLGMFGITAALGCTFFAVSASYVFYEVLRNATLIVRGKRTDQFAKQYCIAVVSMLPFYILTLFVALLYSLI